MTDLAYSPALAIYGFIPGQILFSIIALTGVACFSYIVIRRMAPLVKSEPDLRFDRVGMRLAMVLRLWLGQWRQPRYMVAGVLHIVIFAGFIVLSFRSVSLVLQGIFNDFTIPWFSGTAGKIYTLVKDYAGTLVFIAAAAAAVRRGIIKPKRYAVPAKYGRDHTAEAICVLGLILTLMVSESLFEAAAPPKTIHHAYDAVMQTSSTLREVGLAHNCSAAPFSLSWVFSRGLAAAQKTTLRNVYLGAYLVHELTFFFFLCFLPFGKHFHVVTSLFNVYFAKLDRGTIKPVKWRVAEEQLDDVKSFGVKNLEDFTWKHILDFYSCADCGRCSDNCPANAAGRPLSPRFITIKARDYSFRHYPVFGNSTASESLIGGIYSEDEIWSCTTCGACEEECPLAIEYIDKIVDLRRGMVDDGNVPQSLQKPLRALEKRGNPYGIVEKKRADWAKGEELIEVCNVKIVDRQSGVSTLYFVDSITSFDDRIQQIGRATAKILNRLGEDFGILGAAEYDSGHEVRRFGEEMLFMNLRDRNTEAILASGAARIVTADPHALNALKKDYRGLPPVEHISQIVARKIRSGSLKLNGTKDGKVYTYHDPCYLGRHNQVYDDPRFVLDAIPGLRRVEMSRSRDRSFCCGGGGLMLFYEPEEEQRMGVLRVRMAAEAGANVLVTACPFCMVNIEDAIKVAGMEGKMIAVDLAELVAEHIPH